MMWSESGQECVARKNQTNGLSPSLLAHRSEDGLTIEIEADGVFALSRQSCVLSRH